MKKITKRICVFLLFTILAILFPRESYAICNTASFTKDLKAVQLTLADGTVYSHIVFEKGTLDSQPSPNLNNLKDLKLIFVIRDTLWEAAKGSIKDFVDNGLYPYYSSQMQNGESKINIGILLFKDQPDSKESLDPNGIWKKNQEEIDKGIEELEISQYDYSLNEALQLARGILEEYPGNNNTLAQQIVLVTNKVEKREGANIVLKDLAEQRMVGLYGIFYQTMANEMEDLLDKVPMVTAKIDDWNGLIGQLKGFGENVGNVFQYIKDTSVNTANLVPIGKGANAFVSPAGVTIMIDEEFIHGATLKIEYEMNASRYAYYANGELEKYELVDRKDKKLNFSREESLLTDTSKKNADFGWHQEGDVIKTENLGLVRLVLNSVITREQFNAKEEDNSVYNNQARCMMQFQISESSDANYDITATAPSVTLLVPFGGKNPEEKTTKRIYYFGIGIIGGVILSGTAIRMSLRRKKRR